MLLPELIPHVISHLPLSRTPSTVLSLAKTCKRLHSIVVPRVLYSCIILQDEDSAIDVVQRLLHTPELARTVRELHISSSTSQETRDGTKPFCAVDGLMQLVSDCAIPNLHTLGLYLDWIRSPVEHNEDTIPGPGYSHLTKSFWDSLSKNCPGVRSITLYGNQDYGDSDPCWMNNSGMLSLRNLTSFRLSLYYDSLSPERIHKLFRNLSLYSSNLHTLKVSMSYPDSNHKMEEFLSCEFPCLVKLSLHCYNIGGIDSIDRAMKFWKKHTFLQWLDLDPSDCYFSSNVEEDLLPNLIHLSSGFDNVRALHFRLKQLKSLKVLDTVNYQVPYLLMDVNLREPLPRLECLIIEQNSSEYMYMGRRIEGYSWGVKDDGSFGMGSARAIKVIRKVDATYMNIIAKVAPNLKELGLLLCDTDALKRCVPFLAAFPLLERFYCYGPEYSTTPEEEENEIAEKKKILSIAYDVAQICHRLRCLVDVQMAGRYRHTHLHAKIIRNADNTVHCVEERYYPLELFWEEDALYPEIVW